MKKALLFVILINLLLFSSCTSSNPSPDGLSPSNPESSSEGPEFAGSEKNSDTSTESNKADASIQDTSSGSTSTDAETEQKELVLTYCTDVYDAVTSAELCYSNYVTYFNANVSAGKDAYTLSETAYDSINESLNFLQKLDRENVKELEGFADFNYYSAAYTSGMLTIPKRVMDSLDGEVDITNYNIEQDSELIFLYKDAYKSSLVSFLESVGYEWDEVSSWFYDWE